MSFKAISSFSSGGHMTVCAILVEDIMRTFLWIYFEFGPVVQMSFKDISILALFVQFC